MLVDPADFPEYRASPALWRSSTGGTPARVGGTLDGLLMPAAAFRAAALDPAPEGLAGARYDMAFVYAGTVVRTGDELRVVARGGGGTARYPVARVDQWGIDAVCFVERPH